MILRRIPIIIEIIIIIMIIIIEVSIRIIKKIKHENSKGNNETIAIHNIKQIIINKYTIQNMHMGNKHNT